MLPLYEILELIGAGGMGAIYKARQRSLNRVVALKILPLGLADDEFRFVERFRQEARTMAAMNHPAIVGVHDFGETPDGLLYFVMEFVEGTDLLKLIQAKGRVPPEHALTIAAHVCDALAYAHARGVVHRDIKPANILIDGEGRVKVADFGLARMHDAAQTRGLTRSDMAMGTPDYVAPEILIPGVTADHRADLYAVGVMLYQMLTGEVPRGMFKLPSQKLAECDLRFDEIICKAMEQDRDERYQSAIEVRGALDAIRTSPMAKINEPTVALELLPPAQPEARATPGRARWLAVVAAVAGVGVLVAGGWFAFGAKDRSSTSAKAGAPPVNAAFLAEVAAAPAERQVELVKAKLDELNPGKLRLTPTIKQGKVAVLVVHADGTGERPHLWPLGALRDLDGLQIYSKGTADIEWLRGMKLSKLTVENGVFTDLTVLKDLPVTYLGLSHGPKRDYAPLAGKQLRFLGLNGCPVSDLSFVTGMPIENLGIEGTGLADLSPIRSLPLKEISGDFVFPRDTEILRAIPSLEKINGKPAAEFWAATKFPASNGALVEKVEVRSLDDPR